MVAYPGLASLSCSDCQEHLYDIPSGELQTFETDEGDLPIVRGDAPTPCHICPRGGPEQEHQYRLTARNLQAWMLYEKLQATMGAYRLPEHLVSCELFAENMRLVKVALESGKAELQRIANEQAARDADSPVD